MSALQQWEQNCIFLLRTWNFRISRYCRWSAHFCTEHRTCEERTQNWWMDI